VFFPISAEETSKALGQIRRLRHSGNWKRIGASDAYWNAPFLAALVDAVDNSLLEKPLLAFELSTECIRLAERMRQESCPSGSEVGKRSLIAWAYAVHGSSCRTLERYPEAEAAFQKALWLNTKGVLTWASGEIWRRYAALHLCRGSLAGFDFVDKSVPAYAGFPAAQADALVLRGLFHHCLNNDLSAAARDLGKALELVEAKRSAREARTWNAAVHNLAAIYANGTSDLTTLESTLKRVHGVTAGLSRHEPYRRMLCLSVEALLLAPLGATRKSERLLNRARKWLFAHEHFRQGVLCSVDLALIRLREGDTDAARGVISELPNEARNAEAPLVFYLEHRLATGLLPDVKSENLVSLREVLATFAGRPGSEIPQPLGMKYGPSSTGGSPSALADAGTSTPSG